MDYIIAWIWITEVLHIQVLTQLTQNVVATSLDGRILVRSDLTLWRRFHDVGSWT